eukprot:TRINITY_DN4607_c0_g1_i1.p1 TRINITY_DN4607_c0_g1~~TRINITY_DN4607_c0_g1_i1.p1  ORF type:complete len:1175 (+),score=261.37 TRINITY_DN4607_c0_g1_i1:609-4133(+)
MRGGKFEQKGGGDDAGVGGASRNAEGLFETRTVVEIREVEARTRVDIEEKKEELRQLVGASYRDLIESADSILEMRRSCDAVVANIRAMEGGFATLQRSVTVASMGQPPGADEQRQRRQRLYALGTRVKYLVDTPEKIWGCLDEHMYLEGAERYLRAGEVHQLLLTAAEKTEQKELLAAFPLLRHQWPLVETFKNQIVQRSRDRLHETSLQAKDYAVALAAVSVMEDLDSPQVLALFLQSRRAWVRTQLKAAAGRPAATPHPPHSALSTSSPSPASSAPAPSATGFPPDVAASLCHLVSLIQITLCHAGELFLEVSTGKRPLLFATVHEVAPGSQLFGGIPNPDKEVQLWREQRLRQEERVTPLAGRTVQEGCQAWLQQVAEDIAVEGRLILETIPLARDLAAIEHLVRASMTRQETFSSSMPWLTAAFGAAPDSPWDCIWELILKEPLDLWSALFEAAFLQRAKGIFRKAFSELTVEKQVEEYLAKAEAPPGVGFGTMGTDLLLPAGGQSGAVEGPDLAWKMAGSDKEWAQATSGNYFSAPVNQLRHQVDDKLHDVLTDVLPLLVGPSSAARASDIPPFLQDQCHAAMLAIIHGLEARLEALSAVPPGGDTTLAAAPQATSADGARTDQSQATAAAVTVERALLIGRFCSALAQYSRYLPVLLGPHTRWLQLAKGMGIGVPHGGPGGAAGDSATGPLLPHRLSSSSHPSDLSSLLDPSSRRLSRLRGPSSLHDPSLSSSPPYGTEMLHSLQRHLRRVSISAHRIWVEWSAKQLGDAFMRNLFPDEGLAAKAPCKGWEETVLKLATEEGEKEDRAWLPAMPSKSCLLLLFAGVREVHRVGSHTLDRAVLRLFAWKLQQQVLAAFDSLVMDDEKMKQHVSEDGVLQLLFDIKFLADVLSGGSEISTDALQEDENVAVLGGGMAGHLGGFVAGKRSRGVHLTDKEGMARKARLTALSTSLQARLDPVFWAFFEEQLWENEKRYYHRCAILYGSLIQLNRLYTDSPPKHTPSTADTNRLQMSAVVPRFTLLPISAPLLSAPSTAATVASSRLRRTPSVDAGHASLSSTSATSAAASWAGSNGHGPTSSAQHQHYNNKYSFSDREALSMVGVVKSNSTFSSPQPLFQSIMGQVGSAGYKLGSMVSEGQVGRNISTFGDMMLPSQAAGLFSSLTTGSSS